MIYVLKANIMQIEQFKREYCRSSDRRFAINEDFAVEVMSYEELSPGKAVRSYATGSREINSDFIVFKVTNTIRDITYYPVFSGTVGRELVKEWGMELPSKMTVFACDGNGGGGNHGTDSHIIQRKDENRKMLRLIQFARSMMILHINEPEPMGEPFRGIYDKLEKNPRYNVFESDIKSINTAILHFFNKPVNTKNENFTNLQQYIVYLQGRYPNRHLKNFDFNVLRNKMLVKYPNETIAF